MARSGRVVALSHRIVDQPLQRNSDRIVEIGVGEARAAQPESGGDTLDEGHAFFHRQGVGRGHHRRELSVVENEHDLRFNSA